MKMRMVNGHTIIEWKSMAIFRMTRESGCRETLMCCKTWATSQRYKECLQHNKTHSKQLLLNQQLEKLLKGFQVLWATLSSKKSQFQNQMA